MWVFWKCLNKNFTNKLKDSITGELNIMSCMTLKYWFKDQEMNFKQLLGKPINERMQINWFLFSFEKGVLLMCQFFTNSVYPSCTPWMASVPATFVKRCLPNPNLNIINILLMFCADSVMYKGWINKFLSSKFCTFTWWTYVLPDDTILD